MSFLKDPKKGDTASQKVARRLLKKGAVQQLIHQESLDFHP